MNHVASCWMVVAMSVELFGASSWYRELPRWWNDKVDLPPSLASNTMERCQRYVRGLRLDVTVLR